MKGLKVREWRTVDGVKASEYKKQAGEGGREEGYMTRLRV